MSFFEDGWDEEPDLDFIKDDEEWERRTKGETIVGWINPDGTGRNNWAERLWPTAYHETCGYQWRLHDSRKVGPPEHWKAPFGCPPENVARAAFGDQ